MTLPLRHNIPRPTKGTIDAMSAYEAIRDIADILNGDVYNGIFTQGLVIPKSSDYGIKVDTDIPTWGWDDLIGEVHVKTPGPNDPTLTAFRNNIKEFAFSNSAMNEVMINYHIHHDYKKGTDLFIHTHWAQNVVDTGGAANAPGAVKWQYEVSYAKGHNQAAFPASFTTFVTQTASGTAYQHMLAEVQLSAAIPSATQLDTALIEPDGEIIVRFFRNPADAADTLNQLPFVFHSDIHYQTKGAKGTKQKAPPFYV